MADNGSAQSQDTKMWPLPSFHFKVTLEVWVKYLSVKYRALKPNSKKSPIVPVTVMVSRS